MFRGRQPFVHSKCNNILLWTSAVHTFDSANHGTVSRPLLCVCQVCDSVQVRGDEQATRVLTDAQTGILDLVVVDVLVEPHNNSTHLQTYILLSAELAFKQSLPAGGTA